MRLPTRPHRRSADRKLRCSCSYPCIIPHVLASTLRYHHQNNVTSYKNTTPFGFGCIYMTVNYMGENEARPGQAFKELHVTAHDISDLLSGLTYHAIMNIMHDSSSIDIVLPPSWKYTTQHNPFPSPNNFTCNFQNQWPRSIGYLNIKIWIFCWLL